MKSIAITGTKRVNLSKAALRVLRASGHVPCVLYGGKEQVHFASPARDFKKLVYTPDVHTVKINMDGTEYDAIMQELQFEPLLDQLIHVDFLQIFADKPVTMEIPIKLTGASEGVKQGGKLVQKIKKVKLKALQANLPDLIEVNIDALKIGDSFRVSDLNVNNATILDSPNNVIVGVRMTRNVVETPAAAAKAAAPAAAKAAPAAAKAAPAAAKAPAAKK